MILKREVVIEHCSKKEENKVKNMHYPGLVNIYCHTEHITTTLDTL